MSVADFQRIGFVFDDEHGDSGEIDRRAGGVSDRGGVQGGDAGRGEGRECGESDLERGALVGAGAVGGDASAVEFDELFDDREAEAEPAVLAGGGGVGLTEAFEKMGEEIGRDAGAGIANA